MKLGGGICEIHGNKIIITIIRNTEISWEANCALSMKYF